MRTRASGPGGRGPRDASVNLNKISNSYFVILIFRAYSPDVTPPRLDCPGDLALEARKDSRYDIHSTDLCLPEIMRCVLNQVRRGRGGSPQRHR